MLELKRQSALDRLRYHIVMDAFIAEKAFEALADAGACLWLCTSFMRAVASFSSLSGVSCVFLNEAILSMKPAKRRIWFLIRTKNTRAMRPEGMFDVVSRKLSSGNEVVHC